MRVALRMLSVIRGYLVSRELQSMNQQTNLHFGPDGSRSVVMAVKMSRPGAGSTEFPNRQTYYKWQKGLFEMAQAPHFVGSMYL